VPFADLDSCAQPGCAYSSSTEVASCQWLRLTRQQGHSAAGERSSRPIAQIPFAAICLEPACVDLVLNWPAP
jgi:hypothetical protein